MGSAEMSEWTGRRQREGWAGPTRGRFVGACEEWRWTGLEKLTQALSMDWKRFKGSREGTGRKWGGSRHGGATRRGSRA